MSDNMMLFLIVCLCLSPLPAGLVFSSIFGGEKHPPVFRLTDFSILGADKRLSGGGLAKLPVQFTITAHNPNKQIGIYYNGISASVYYGDRVIASGPALPASFYQEPKDSSVVQGDLTATGPTPADPAWAWFADEMSAGGVAMWLQLSCSVRFKWWNQNTHHRTAECEFRIDGNGTLWRRDVNSRCTL